MSLTPGKLVTCMFAMAVNAAATWITPTEQSTWMDQTLMVFNVFVSKPSQANVLRYKVLIPLSTSSLSFAASVSALII